MAQWVMNPPSTHEDAGSVSGLDLQVKDLAFGELWSTPQLLQMWLRSQSCCGCGIGRQLQLE